MFDLLLLKSYFYKQYSIFILMISRILPLAKQTLVLRNYFSSATIDQVNYYNVLGVDSGAT